LATARSDHVLPVAVLYLVGLSPAIAVAIDPRFFHNQGNDAPTLLSPAALKLSQATTVILAGLILCGVLRALMRRSSPVRPWLLALLGYAMAIALSAVFYGGFSRPVVLFIGLVFVAGSCRFESRDVIIKHARWILRLIIAGSLLQMLLRFDDATFVGINDGGRFLGVRQLAGLTPHPNGLGLIAAFSLLLDLYIRRGRYWRAWTLTSVVVLLLTQSRSGWLAALVGVLIWSDGRFGRARTGLVAGLAGLFGWLAVGQSVSQNGLTGRDKVWDGAWSAFIHRPILGGGPLVLRDEFAGTRLAFGAQAHNQVLDALAKTGLIGTIFLLLFVTCGLALALRSRREGDSLQLALLGVLAAGSLFESPVSSSVPMLTVVAVLAARPVLGHRYLVNASRPSARSATTPASLAASG